MAENEHVEVLVQQPGAVTKTAEEIGKELERRFELQDRILATMCKYIDPQVDLVMIEGNPAKTSNFAHKLYRIVGGTFEYVKDVQGHPMVSRMDHSDNEGAYYVYEAFGRYQAPYGDGGWFEASGAWSSRQKFFGRVDGSFKPVEQVDEQNVRQAALTECFKKCIFGALGIGALQADKLKELGVDTTNIRGYTFKKGTKGGDTDSDVDSDVRAKIEMICQELANQKFSTSGNPTATTPGQVLKQITHREYEKDGKKQVFTGYDNFKKITVKSLGLTLKRCEEAEQSWTALD